MQRAIYTIVIMISFLLLVGCSSQVLKIDSPDKDRPYKEVGYVTGRASGILIFGLIPVNQNSRMTSAYNIAYNQAKSYYHADALTNVNISEKWFNFVVFMKFIVTVKGDAIKYTDTQNEVIEEETQEVYLFKMN